MGSRVFILLGLLFAIVLIASEVSARQLAETEQIEVSYGRQDGPRGGGDRGRYGYGGRNGGRGQYGGGYRGGGGRCGSYGCCGGVYFCRCCTSAAEAEAYAASQAKAKPRN